MQGTFSRSLEMHRHETPGKRSEDRALDFHTVLNESCGINRLLQRQRAMVAVVTRELGRCFELTFIFLPFRRHVNEQRAQRQEPHTVLTGEEVAVDDTLGLLFFAVANEFTHPLQRIFGMWCVVVVR